MRHDIGNRLAPARNDDSLAFFRQRDEFFEALPNFRD